MNLFFFRRSVTKLLDVAWKSEKSLVMASLSRFTRKHWHWFFWKKEFFSKERSCFLLRFKDKVLSKKYFADFFCCDEIIVELKAMDGLNDDPVSQVLNYLKATGKKLGLLVNFGKSRLEYRREIL